MVLYTDDFFFIYDFYVFISAIYFNKNSSLRFLLFIYQGMVVVILLRVNC